MIRIQTTRIQAALISVAFGAATSAVLAIDGVNIPTEYTGYLVASQVNPTGFGNGGTQTLSGPNELSIGSELDRLYVTSDLQNVWIGITGNLPNKLADSQGIVILMQVNEPTDCDDPQTPPWPADVLTVSGLPGFGGGHADLMGLNGLKLPADDNSLCPDTGFHPDYAIVVNRSTGAPPNSVTYANAWYFPTNLELPFDPALTSLDPANGLYMSVYMNTTNTAGVTSSSQPADGSGVGTQGELAASAVKGLRVRLSGSGTTPNFGIGAFSTIKLAAILTSPSGFVSNQTLPPITPINSPAYNNCFAQTQPVSQGAGTFDPVYFKTQDAAYNLFSTVTLSNLGAPGASGKDGSDIPAGFPVGSLRATQQLHTCFADATPNPNPPLQYTVAGSELDALYVKRDANIATGYLNIGVTGNLEANGNRAYLFIDSGNEAVYNTIQPIGDPNDGCNWLRTWFGRKFDPGFNPRHVYVVSNSGGTLFVDHYDRAVAYQTSGVNCGTERYLGKAQVGSGTGLLIEGSNPNNDEFALDNSNSNGVGGTSDPPGDPLTATAGLEARIKLSEIGVTTPQCQTRVAVMLSGGDGGGRSFLSNQSLPSYAPTSQNVGSDPFNNGTNPPTTLPWDFGDVTTTQPGDPLAGLPAFAGDQFAGVSINRQPGDIVDQGNCCINTADKTVFVQVLLGINNNATDKSWADMNGDGSNNGLDIEPFVAAMFANSPCP